MADSAGAISAGLGLTDQANYGDGSNLIGDPSDFSAWTLLGATPPVVNTGADTGPFGGTADVIEFGASNSILEYPVTLIDGARYYFGVWARNHESFIVRLNLTFSAGSVVRYLPADGNWYLIEAHPPVGTDDEVRIQKVTEDAAFDVSLFNADLHLQPRLYYPGWSDQAYPPRIYRQVTPGFSEDPAVDEVLGDAQAATSEASFPPSTPAPLNAPGSTSDELNAGEDWFEEIHILPRRIDLGNVFSTVEETIEIFNADRFADHELQVFTNMAGAGISITDLPSLPETIYSLTSLVLTLEVLADGPPIIDGTLDFDFDLYEVMLPITGTRLVIFPFIPERPIEETLGFLTDVLTRRTGSEQRIKLRKNPRQLLRYNLSLDGDDRRAYDSLMLDWQARLFGLPIWFESTKLTQDAAATDTVLHVQSTRYADYRVGSLLVVIQNRKVFDAIEIASIDSATQITLASPLGFDHPIGTRVMPMRTAFAQATVDGDRRPVRLQQSSILFEVTDNDANLADDGGYPTLLGKIFFSDPNFIRGQVPNNLIRQVYRIDGQTGAVVQSSPWDRGKRSTMKGIVAVDRAARWNLRRLLHQLSGRLTSFYLPTFNEELVPSAQLTSGSPTLTIENVGYAAFVQNRKGLLRVTLTNGTTLIRTVSASSEIDADTEQITLVETWPSTIQPEDVLRIEYVELCRSLSDDLVLTHLDDTGQTQLEMPVVEVLDE